MNKPIIDLTGAKILTVDYVPANLDVLSQSLKLDGYNVLVATIGEAAIQVAKQTSPDLILLEVLMPGIDGFETCRRLKADPEPAGSPVIFQTARNELEGLQAGGVDYIAKPFQQESAEPGGCPGTVGLPDQRGAGWSAGTRHRGKGQA